MKLEFSVIQYIYVYLPKAWGSNIVNYEIITQKNPEYIYNFILWLLI